MVWYDMAWYGIIMYGIAYCSMAWYGCIRYQKVKRTFPRSSTQVEKNCIVGGNCRTESETISMNM